MRYYYNSVWVEGNFFCMARYKVRNEYTAIATIKMKLVTNTTDITVSLIKFFFFLLFWNAVLKLFPAFSLRRINSRIILICSIFSSAPVNNLVKYLVYWLRFFFVIPINKNISNGNRYVLDPYKIQISLH